MLVLLQEDNLPPMSWRLAITSETFPGSDGHVIVVNSENQSGQFKRLIQRLVALPVNAEILNFSDVSRG
jgi:hypothetical protein